VLKRIINVLFVMLLVSLSSFANIYATADSSIQNAQFSDIAGHWAQDSINNAVSAGYVGGYKDGTFKPNNNVTKEEFMSMLIRALQIKTEPQKDGETWFAPIQSGATKNGLFVQGDYNNNWSDPITRGEMAITLERATHNESYSRMLEVDKKRLLDFSYLKNQYFQYEEDYKFLNSQDGLKLNIEETSPNLKDSLLTLSDWYHKKQDQFQQENKQEGIQYCNPDAEKWYIDQYKCLNKKDETIYPAVKRFVGFLNQFTTINNQIKQSLDSMYNKMDPKQMIFESARRGLIAGTGTGELSLDSPTTRAQAVVVIQRILSYNQGKSLQVDKYAVGAAEVNWHKTNMFSLWPNFLGVKNASKFDTSQFHYESDYYKGDFTGLYIIDADDPNDPNWSKLRSSLNFPLDEYYALVSGYHALPVSTIHDAYFILATQSKNQVEDPKWNKVQLVSLSGVGIDTGKNDGSLSSMSPLIHKTDWGVGKSLMSIDDKAFEIIPSTVYVLPKKNVITDDNISVNLAASVTGNVPRSNVLMIKPEGIQKLNPVKIKQGNFVNTFFKIDELN
jgi:hypothetical protein